jgi:uroporphyrinogen-III synthase
LVDQRKIVAVLRASDDARATSARLAELGFAVALAPVLAPVGLAAAAPDGRFDAVAATSAKALDFAPAGLLAAVAGLPLHVVGSAGRCAAERRGLAVAGEAEEAAALARALAAALPRGARALYLAGADRKGDLEAALAAAGIAVETVEVYAARAREAWDQGEAAAVARAGAALHYSRRSAELATHLAERAGIGRRWRTMPHVAISADAAAPLRAAGAESVVVAAAPNEPAMLALLASTRFD